jgi:hypothetical protein
VRRALHQQNAGAPTVGHIGEGRTCLTAHVGSTCVARRVAVLPHAHQVRRRRAAVLPTTLRRPLLSCRHRHSSSVRGRVCAAAQSHGRPRELWSARSLARVPCLRAWGRRFGLFCVLRAACVRCRVPRTAPRRAAGTAVCPSTWRQPWTSADRSMRCRAVALPH